MSGDHRAVSVVGGTAGVEAHYDQFARMARTFLDVSRELAERSLDLHRVFLDPSVIAAAVLNPPGAATFAAALLLALDAPGGLSWHAAACTLTATEIRTAAASYLAVDRLDKQVGPAAEGLLRLGPAGAAAATHWRSPGRMPGRLLTGDPQLVDTAVGALTDFWTDRLLIDRVAAYPDGRPVVAATGRDTSPASGSPPRSLADVVAGLARRNLARRGGDVDVRFVVGLGPDGQPVRRVIVDIPGTKNWSPSPHGSDPTSLGTNARAVTGGTTTYEEGVREVMRRAGVRPGDQVLLVGHSQGGMVALNLARHARETGEFAVTHVITAGSPIARIPVPRSVRVLAIENDGDVVPHCDGADNQDRTNVTTVTVHRDTGDVVANHTLENGYLPGAGDIDASDNPSVRSYLDSLHPFLDGTKVDTRTFRIERR